MTNMSYWPIVKKIIPVLFIYFILVDTLLAQSNILINEFLIDPQPQQVELFNSSDQQTDISGWIIDDSGGTSFYTIPQESIINPHSCLVFSGDLNLNKTSADTIRLFNNAELIDSFSYKSSSGSGISYMRIPDGENNWTTSPANLGKFNTQPEQICLNPTLMPTTEPILTVSPTSTTEPQPDPTATPEPSPVLYRNIYLSEVMVNPEPGGGEWVELYNDNDFTVDLKNWYLDDVENSGSSPKLFDLEIKSKNYNVINLTSSIYNNGGDSVRLLDFDKNIYDEFEYETTSQGQSYGRISLAVNDFCLQQPSYGQINNPCANSSSTPTPSAGISPTETEPLITTSVITPKLIKNESTTTVNSKNPQTYKDENILGITTKTSPKNKTLMRLLSTVSLSYSLLTIISLLIKMKILYGKGKEFLSSFIYSG